MWDAVHLSGVVNWDLPWASGVGLYFLGTRQEVDDTNQHRAQASQESPGPLAVGWFPSESPTVASWATVNFHYLGFSTWAFDL